MKKILQILFLFLIALSWASLDDSLHSSHKERSAKNNYAVFYSAADDESEKDIRQRNALPFNKEGNISSAPQLNSVAARFSSEETRISQRRFRYNFYKRNKTNCGLQSFKPTIYTTTGGFIPKPTTPVGTTASHKLIIYVLRHIIR